VHTAAPLHASCTSTSVIQSTAASVTNILRSAARTNTIKRFVMTSSMLAAYYPPMTERTEIGRQSYNELSCKLAYTIGDDQALLRSFHIYCATKVESEKTAWEFIRKEKVSRALFLAFASGGVLLNWHSQPAFVFNTVLPDVILGPSIIPRKLESTGSWLKLIYDNHPMKEEITTVPPRKTHICLTLLPLTNIPTLHRMVCQHQRCGSPPPDCPDFPNCAFRTPHRRIRTIQLERYAVSHARDVSF
jgi:hypothetical protein